MISGFRHEVHEKCALVCYCAASSGNLYQRFRTTYRSQVQWSILHVVDSEINDAAVSLVSSHMSESCGPHSSSSSPPPPVSSSFLLVTKKQSTQGKKKDKIKKEKILYFILFLAFSTSIISQLALFVCISADFTATERKQERRKRKQTALIHSLIFLLIYLHTYLFSSLFTHSFANLFINE